MKKVLYAHSNYLDIQLCLGCNLLDMSTVNKRPYLLLHYITSDFDYFIVASFCFIINKDRYIPISNINRLLMLGLKLKSECIQVIEWDTKAASLNYFLVIE